VGIAREVLPRVFDPFFTTKRAGEGLGLGLSISHGVVRDLGGAIAVESVPGRGTTFQITLPSAKGFRRVSSPNLKCASIPPPPSRVLIVDDDPLVAESLALTLRGENEVTVSTSPREVLEILARGEEYDVILCDLLMPEMAGAELYAELLRTAPSAVGRIVFMTGGALSARTRAFVEGIGKTCLAKPLDARELRDLVRSRSRASAG
jgi:CheY-like chemotaxis protein